MSNVEKGPLDVMPVVMYKDGKPLEDLARMFKECASDKQRVEVIIAPEHMTSNNKQVKARQLWGDKVYTDDSDLVAVLMHLGYYSSTILQPPEKVLEFHAMLQLLPPQSLYFSNFRNAVRSRSWCTMIDGCSYQVERCWLLTRAGNEVDLQPNPDDGSTINPTFAPSMSDRQMNTRSNAGGSRTKSAQEVTILYNLCNEPWGKYTLAAIADRGLRPSQLTSARVTQEVLFIETFGNRFQLSFTGLGGGEDGSDQKPLYSFGRCKAALPMTVMKSIGLPMGPEHVEEVEGSVDWEEFRWGHNALHLRDKEYRLLRLHFMPCHNRVDRMVE